MQGFKHPVRLPYPREMVDDAIRDKTTDRSDVGSSTFAGEFRCGQFMIYDLDDLKR